jgi:hypothetical protein
LEAIETHNSLSASIYKKRQPIDEMIDARRQESRVNRRPLTLDDVPAELLAEYR